MQPPDHIVVSGLGLVSALGLGVGSFWGALCAGRPGISLIQSFDASRFTCKAAGQVGDIAQSPHYNVSYNLHDRFTAFALLAANEAIAQAGICGDSTRLANVGTYVGTGIGGVYSHEKACGNYVVNHNRPSPAEITRVMSNAAAGRIAVEHGFGGPSLTVSSACASGSQAIGEAFEALRRGDVDMAVAGGAEAPLSEPLYAAWSTMRVLSNWNGEVDAACRPFSADRSGLVLGEGAAFVVLERASHARARGAQVLGRIRSYATNTTIEKNLTSQKVEPLVAVMNRAIEKAALSANDISYVSAHGTGTRSNDSMETKALHQVFGSCVNGLRVSSSKAQLGHTLGGAGAFGMVIGLLALRDRLAPPTMNLDRPDPECDLDYVALRAQPLHRDGCALVNAFGFGGTNVAIVVDAAA